MKKTPKYQETPRDKACREKNAQKDMNQLKRGINIALKEIKEIYKSNFSNFELYKNLNWKAPNVLRQNLIDIQLIRGLIERRSVTLFNEALRAPENKKLFKKYKIRQPK